jgi:DNA invertase Pin-like site-specific DNA recombinase
VAEKSENEPHKIGYARVSTSEQNLDMQIEALKKYGVKERLIFTDKMSGASDKRPGFVHALKAAQHKGTELVVWKLDRLGRTVMGIIETLQLLDSRGVHLVSLTERIDLGTPFGKAIVGFLAVFAELERNLIRERTLAGIRRAKERGEPHGRPTAMTEERIKVATQMLAEGKHMQNEILPAMKKMSGPPVSRSVLYAWAKDQRRLLPLEYETDDR